MSNDETYAKSALDVQQLLARIDVAIELCRRHEGYEGHIDTMIALKEDIFLNPTPSLKGA